MTKSWFFEMINKINKLLATLTKEKKRKDTNKIRNEREVTMDTTEIKRIVQEYYGRFYATKIQ